jgi:hypothetical protein
MHPTADTLPVINSNGLGRRVMPGVRSPEGSGLEAQKLQAASLGRSNKRMHATAHSAALISVGWGGA